MPKSYDSHSPPGKRVSSDGGSASETEQHNSLTSNGLLARLAKSELDKLATRLSPMRMEIGDVLYEPEEPIEHVYFPTTGVISLLAAFEDGGSVEAGLMGAEGMLGTPVILGAETTPHLALVQASGHAFKMSVRDLKSFTQNDGQLRELLLHFTNALFTQVAQTAGCNRAHTLEQRLARWLLLTHDRVPGDEFQLTQDFLSRMLGVRRAGVSVAANTLRELRAIDYRRGNVIILDRKGLEKASCECYQVVKDEYDRVL